MNSDGKEDKDAFSFIILGFFHHMLKSGRNLKMKDKTRSQPSSPGQTRQERTKEVNIIGRSMKIITKPMPLGSTRNFPGFLKKIRLQL